MAELVNHPEHLQHWQKAMSARWEGGPKPSRQEWDKVLGTYQAGADLPFHFFAAELIELYPEAKVILTNKDPDAFWQSWSKASSYVASPPWYLRVLRYVDPTRGAEARREDVILRCTHHQMDGDFFDEQKVKRAFKEHYDLVRRLVPTERLLEYRLEQGWQPLCKFLGESVPDEDFPKGNSLPDFQRTISLLWALETVTAFIKISSVVGFAYVAQRFMVRYNLLQRWI